ncbi:hypothetical protein TorRG33x02_036320, partial [Trema orientale]
PRRRIRRQRRGRRLRPLSFRLLRHSHPRSLLPSRAELPRFAVPEADPSAAGAPRGVRPAPGSLRRRPLRRRGERSRPDVPRLRQVRHRRRTGCLRQLRPRGGLRHAEGDGRDRQWLDRPGEVRRDIQRRYCTERV